MMRSNKRPPKHVVLASHPRGSARRPPPIDWGAATPEARGPVIGTLADPARRNVIGVHAGSFALYRALAVAAGSLDPVHVPDLTDTAPAEAIAPSPQWSDRAKIVSLDPYGHMVSDVFAGRLAEGWDIRPTIAVAKARINMPELKAAIRAGRLTADGDILSENGDVSVTKVAIEPVWHLPGVAGRCGELRRRNIRRHCRGTVGGPAHHRRATPCAGGSWPQASRRLRQSPAAFWHGAMVGRRSDRPGGGS